jgi:hypothetical protein
MSHCSSSRTRDACSSSYVDSERRTISNPDQQLPRQRRTTRTWTSTIHDDSQQHHSILIGGAESSKRRLDQEFDLDDDVDVVVDSSCPGVRPESSGAVINDNVTLRSCRSVKEEKEKELHQNYEKRLLKVFQDNEIRQRQMIADAMGKVQTNNAGTTCRKRGKKCSPENTKNHNTISSKVKSLWPIRARKTATTTATRNNKENDKQQVFQSLSERRETSSEETTCRDRSSCRTLAEVSLSALGSQDDDHEEDDDDDDKVEDDGPSIVFHSPVTPASGDKCYPTLSIGPQSSLSLPVLIGTKNRMVDDNNNEEDEAREPRMTPTSQLSSVALDNNTERESSRPLKRTSSSSLPNSRKMDSTILTRRMQLGAIRTVAMDGIVESYPDIHDMVVVVEDCTSESTGGTDAGGTTTYTQLALPEHCQSHSLNRGLVVIPASPEEAAYYTTSLPPSESRKTSRREASTYTLSWL